jgi:hypothetical protein
MGERCPMTEAMGAGGDERGGGGRGWGAHSGLGDHAATTAVRKVSHMGRRESE